MTSPCSSKKTVVTSDFNLPAKHHDGSIARLITACTKMVTERGMIFPTKVADAVEDAGYFLDAPQYMPAGAHYGIRQHEGGKLAYSAFIERA
jgi:hypothetical protein